MPQVGGCVCGLPLPASKRPRGGSLPSAGWRSSCHVTSHPSLSLFSAYFLTFPALHHLHTHMHIDTKAFSHSCSCMFCVLSFSSLLISVHTECYFLFSSPLSLDIMMVDLRYIRLVISEHPGRAAKVLGGSN